MEKVLFDGGIGTIIIQNQLILLKQCNRKEIRAGKDGRARAGRNQGKKRKANLEIPLALLDANVGLDGAEIVIVRGDLHLEKK